VALALPLGIAVALVSIFTRPGATVLFTIGPLDATVEGADFAAKIVVRLFVMAAALVLFGLTTTTRDLVVDLERRGVSPRLAFALGAVTGTVPALVGRAMDVRDAQRARALDTEGSLLRRARGIVPLVGPVVIGSLHEVEARSLALEARAFGRPGPRHLLWAPADASTERALRWLLIGAFVVVIAGSAAGFVPPLP
jgi:energy-coupling factor transport system permease protein